VDPADFVRRLIGFALTNARWVRTDGSPTDEQGERFWGQGAIILVLIVVGVVAYLILRHPT
jgi:hypothetical protein